jgi:hypothetical protein
LVALVQSSPVVKSMDAVAIRCIVAVSELLEVSRECPVPAVAGIEEQWKVWDGAVSTSL